MRLFEYLRYGPTERSPNGKLREVLSNLHTGTQTGQTSRRCITRGKRTIARIRSLRTGNVFLTMSSLAYALLHNRKSTPPSRPQRITTRSMIPQYPHLVKSTNMTRKTKQLSKSQPDSNDSIDKTLTDVRIIVEFPVTAATVGQTTI